MIKYFIKTIILILLLFITVSANNWFVTYREGTSDNLAHDGRTWATAWSYLDSSAWVGYDGVNWNIVSSGDTVFLDGGAEGDTVFYYASNYGNYIQPLLAEPYTFAGGSMVVITTSTESGHNGTVIFTPKDVSSGSFGNFNRISNIKLVNLKFINMVTPTDTNDAEYISGVGVGDGSNNAYLDSLITFENCYFYNEMGGCIGIRTTKVTMKNCTIITNPNIHPREADPISCNTGLMYIIYDNCAFIYLTNYIVPASSSSGIVITDTSLYDPSLNMLINLQKDRTINVGSGTYFLNVTSNTSNTFYGTVGWQFTSRSGSTPISDTVSTTTTSLTDLRLSIPTNAYVGVVISCNGKTLTVTSNSNNTFTGSGGWSGGGTPGDGYSWATTTHPTHPITANDWEILSSLPHRDVLQFSDNAIYGSPEGYTAINTIKNCIIVAPYATSAFNSFFYSSAGSFSANQKWFVYNNIIVSGGSEHVGMISLGSAAPPARQSFFILNNTVITCKDGDGDANFVNVGVAGRTDSVIVLNNIYMNYGYASDYIGVPAFYYGLYTRQIDYNAYYEWGGMDTTYTKWPSEGFGASDWVSWHTGGLGFPLESNPDTTIYRPPYDVHTIKGNSQSYTTAFDTIYSIYKTGYYTTVGRDIGVDLTTMFPQLSDIGYDALGNPRGVNGAWDMGALEFQGSGEINKIMGVTSPSKILGKTINKIFGIIFVP